MPIQSQEGQNYLRDMEWCQQYAYHNCAAMKRIMLDIISDVTKCEPDMNRSVNIHHNYCQCEDCGRELPSSNLPLHALRCAGVLIVGSSVFYYDRHSQSYKRATVMAVDTSLSPPSYRIKIGSSERETERSRIFVNVKTEKL